MIVHVIFQQRPRSHEKENLAPNNKQLPFILNDFLIHI